MAMADVAEEELKTMPSWQTIPSGSDDSGPTSASPFVFRGRNGYGYRGKGFSNEEEEEELAGSSGGGKSASVMAAMVKFLLPTRRRLRLDPPNKLYFPYEPGNQVRSAIEIKNVGRSPVCFKFQTTAPKSCYMRPPGGVLVPGESLIATVFKFVEPPENGEKALHQNNQVKFKIMSMKVDGDQHYVPEMFDEKNNQVAVEQILRVVFLDPHHPSPILEKLKRQLAEADAALESRKRPSVGNAMKALGGGGALVLDEWKKRRENYPENQLVQHLE